MGNLLFPMQKNKHASSLTGYKNEDDATYVRVDLLEDLISFTF